MPRPGIGGGADSTTAASTGTGASSVRACSSGFYPYYGYAYPYPYYDYPPVVVTPPPTDYVQRAPSTPVSGYWHYCQDPAGYYPTVAACPSGWIQVAPRTE